MYRKIGFRSFVLFLAFALALCSTLFYVGEIEARETSPEYVGEVMADTDGGVFVLSGSGERLKVTSSPMPIFDGSLIEAKKGSAVIRLAPDGLVEVMKGSEIKIVKLGERINIAINSGSIRFSVPAMDRLSIIIPSEGISITMALSLASTSENIVIDSGARAGFIELREDGSAIVSSLKGSLEVSADDGKTMVLDEGKSLMVVAANTTTGENETKKRAMLLNATKSKDLLMLTATVGAGATVAIISSNTDSGSGWVASGP